MVQDAPAVVKVQQICGAGGMDLYLDERDRAEGLWAQPFRPVRHPFCLKLVFQGIGKKEIEL